MKTANWIKLNLYKNFDDDVFFNRTDDYIFEIVSNDRTKKDKSKKNWTVVYSLRKSDPSPESDACQDWSARDQCADNTDEKVRKIWILFALNFSVNDVIQLWKNRYYLIY